MKKSSSILLAACAVGSVLALGGCFGGNDVNSSPQTPAVTAAVPANASVNVSDFIAYLKALVVASADTLEPVKVDMVTPPTTDTAEPDPLN